MGYRLARVQENKSLRGATRNINEFESTRRGIKNARSKKTDEIIRKVLKKAEFVIHEQ